MSDERVPPSAHQTVASMRLQEPLLAMKPRTSRDDPEFMSTFFKASRLHYIGMWKIRYQELLGTLPPPPPLPKAAVRLIAHVGALSPSEPPPRQKSFRRNPGSRTPSLRWPSVPTPPPPRTLRRNPASRTTCLR
jgi:hypothetical protein